MANYDVLENEDGSNDTSMLDSEPSTSRAASKRKKLSIQKEVLVELRDIAKQELQNSKVDRQAMLALEERTAMYQERSIAIEEERNNLLKQMLQQNATFEANLLKIVKKKQKNKKSKKSTLLSQRLRIFISLSRS